VIKHGVEMLDFFFGDGLTNLNGAKGFLLFISIFLLCRSVRAQNSQTVVNGAPTAPITISASPVCIHNWVNNKPAIGLPASGTGNIPSFIATNNGTTPITATITATPVPFAYIANEVSNTVSVINMATHNVVASMAVGNSPTGVAVSQDGSRVYITNSSFANPNVATVSVISAVTNSVIGSIPQAKNSEPFGVAVSPDGSKLYVVNSGLNSVWVFDTATYAKLATITLPDGFPVGIAVSGDGKRVYVASDKIPNSVSNNALFVIDATSNTLSATIQLINVPGGIALSPDGSKIYIINLDFSGYVTVVNTTNNAVASYGPFPGTNRYGIAVSPDGSKVYLTNPALNTISVYNTATNTVSATIAVGVSPYGISVTPDGSLVCVTNPASNNVSIINAATNTVIAAVPVDSTPFSFGNFIKVGSGCTPVTFTITVNPTTAVITHTNALSALNTVYGTASASSSFTVSGIQITNGILVNPPPGFEVSLDNMNFSPAVTVAGNGSIAATPVYIRLAAATAAGSYTGNIVLSSPNAVNINIPMPASTVTPAHLTITANNQTRIYGIANPVFTVIYSGFVNNDGPSNLTTLPLVSTTANMFSLPGSYPITASGAASSNYNFTYLPGVLTITPGFQNLTIPNAFTPNGDGINDTWNIKYLDTFPNCTVQVFNRYGQSLYFSKGYPIPWDGRYKGANLPDGTYYYIIKQQAVSYVYSGYVSIIR